MLGAFIQPRAWRLFCHCRRPSLELDCCRFLFNCRNPGMNFGGCLDADRWCIFGMIAFYNKNIRICVYTLYDTDIYIYTHYMKYTLCARWCTHFSARRRRHITKTHYCQGGYVNEDAKTHFEDTLNEDEFPPEDELPSEDTLRRHIKRRRIPPRRRITQRRHIAKTH